MVESAHISRFNLPRIALQTIKDDSRSAAVTKVLLNKVYSSEFPKC